MSKSKITFNCPSIGTINNNIGDLINKFENSHQRINSSENSRHRKKGPKKQSNQLLKHTHKNKMEETVIENDVNLHDMLLHDELIDKNEFGMVDSVDVKDSFDYVEMNGANYLVGTSTHRSKMQRLKNLKIIRCQLDLFQRFVGILLRFPFFASVNGAGLSTLTCAFFLPRFLCEHILYPIFRLTFGTLYPAYASYKAVRNKDVKEYVSKYGSSGVKHYELAYSV